MASAAFRRWIFASSPPSATQRALFFHALMTYQFSRLTGPIERAEMLVNNTHEYYIFRWPAACFLVLIGGAQNLKLVQHVSHFLWFVCACASTVLAGSDWLGKPERTGFAVRAVHIVERLSTALLACCFILLHGVQSTLVDYQHQYYSVLYSLIALAQPIDSITDKLILTCLAQTYFSGGLAKLLGAGPRWFDGSHLCYLIKERAHWFYLLLRPETFPRLNSALYLIASWGAVLWELSMAPMLVWIDRLGVRCVFIGSAIGFHVAARLLLGASFNAQVGTFLLVLPKPPPAAPLVLRPPPPSTRRWRSTRASTVPCTRHRATARATARRTSCRTSCRSAVLSVSAPTSSVASACASWARYCLCS